MRAAMPRHIVEGRLHLVKENTLSQSIQRRKDGSTLFGLTSLQIETLEMQTVSRFKLRPSFRDTEMKGSKAFRF